MLKETTDYLDEIKHLWPLVTLGCSFLTFIIGLYAGHKAALLRDKRKEFNDSALPIRIKLLKQIDLMESGKYQPPGISLEDIYAVVNRVNKKKANSIKIAFKAYEDSLTYEGLKCYITEGRRVQVGDFSPAIEAARDLLKKIPLQ